MANKIKIHPGNYYGYPHIVERDGKFYIGCEDYDGDCDYQEISKELYLACLKEFKREDQNGK